ncbi:hypothetical protein [Flavisolibacter ginsenosidimutans]|uniref:Uncharacterized protein n=1 Tax=Flavisolibacter ginsenosidimutans TaxID=661481 RepID=A0A5B8UK39_9BACT|nr:hypothetical protein [Flavisolibacter ginsenosidimutans]QEC56796.1 hypothetical protein FSB75_13110 [Flavisolibacter ginsenosidimutans]
MIQIQPGTSVEFKKDKYFIKPLNDSGIVLNVLSFPQSKKAGVYRLRQDNMPCLVPNTKDLVMMPNGFKGEIKVPFVPAKPQIPNPVQSYSYKPNLTK